MFVKHYSQHWSLFKLYVKKYYHKPNWILLSVFYLNTVSKFSLCIKLWIKYLLAPYILLVGNCVSKSITLDSVPIDGTSRNAIWHARFRWGNPSYLGSLPLITPSFITVPSPFLSEHWSQATSGVVSTWMGGHLCPWKLQTTSHSWFPPSQPHNVTSARNL